MHNGKELPSQPESGGVSTGNGLAHGDYSSAPLVAQIESLLFVADEPVAVSDLARVFDTDRNHVVSALAQLADACSARGVRVQRTNGRVQMVSAPESADAIQRFLGLESSARLSRAALEVLAMVAYRQPITRPEVDALRGVNSDASLRTLMSRGLVEPVGRRLTVGHPIEYATTFLFLEYFGLTSLEDLPPVDMLAVASVAAVDDLAPAGDNSNASAGNGSVEPHGPNDRSLTADAGEARGSGAQHQSNGLDSEAEDA